MASNSIITYVYEYTYGKWQINPFNIAIELTNSYYLSSANLYAI